MPITTQFNSHAPIGFSQKNGIPTKGGSVEAVRERLELSKASTSTGLKEMQRIGVVHAVYVPGDRRTFSRPEEDLDKGFRGLVGETVLPHLKTARESIANLTGITGTSLLNDRVQCLNNWNPDSTLLNT